MIPTTTDHAYASAELAKLLAHERKVNGILREQNDDLSAFVSRMFDADREALLANANVTLRDEGGQYLTLADVVAQRDQARNWAVHLENENARLVDRIAQIGAVANDCLGQWGAEHIGNTLLAILNEWAEEQAQ